MYIAILHDSRFGGSLKVSHKIDLIHLAELDSVVLHSGGATDIPVYKHCCAFHKIIYDRLVQHSQSFKSRDLLELPIFFEVELQQLHLFGVEFVDGGDELEIVLEVIVVIIVLYPKIHHFFYDVLETFVVELLLVEGHFLFVDFALED